MFCLPLLSQWLASRFRQWRDGVAARKRLAEIMKTPGGPEGLQQALRQMDYIEINFPNRRVFVSRHNPLNHYTFTNDNTKESNT